MIELNIPRCRELLALYHQSFKIYRGSYDPKALSIPNLASQLELALAEIEALKDALRDCRSGLGYIRHTYGNLYGVGFDRALGKADAALHETENDQTIDTPL